MFAHHNETVGIGKVCDAPNKKPDCHNGHEDINQDWFTFVLHDYVIREEKHKEGERQPEEK